MAHLNQLPSEIISPHSVSFLSPKPPLSFSTSPYATTLSKNHTSLILHPSSLSSTPSSPFTEKHSFGRYQRDSWVYREDPPPYSSCSLDTDSNSIRDDDIALQLPELKRLLQVLRERRANEVSAGGGGKRELGNVFLVGTGPGDPELLTLKALRVIENADLLLYDRLVSNDVLELVRADARLLYVGKTAGYHSRTQINLQEEIHELLLSFAEAGATVVRLKGGDPLVFGRGGEEMDFLQQQGIQVKVIPGITAASGIAAELGIPLTHRGVANSVRFLTGHSRKGGKDPLFVAEHAADPDSTLVVYMGLLTLPSLAQKLMYHGLPPDTPAAAVERGTTPQQRMVFAELKDLVKEVQMADLVSPTLIIIGKVVALSSFWPLSSKEALMVEETR
ncbi:S-adenosyl-L-methionine-dependent uroporphyrinogen III methyltransferase, chloroplastic-like isoform X1 [Magnolia sinica]|uniref:S-adenosyl-L-methionine-dependent uroporphyrinogen III methyltransferase, chloroplastic-like isoform X1 n=1 Tax=Magnolia sinica TaxID=86752 RepID=UPI00265AB142|nr:S-adenosyl-L-methionine-dependent uroporphyrinogen III methyltransferase, chloroplastic-like isoform X1 [Magnolia sinica]